MYLSKFCLRRRIPPVQVDNSVKMPRDVLFGIDVLTLQLSFYLHANKHYQHIVVKISCSLSCFCGSFFQLEITSGVQCINCR